MPWRRLCLLLRALRFATAEGIPLLILVLAGVLVHAEELLLEVFDEVVGIGGGDVPDKIVSNINMS